MPKADAYLKITLISSHLIQIGSKFLTVIFLYSIFDSFKTEAVPKDQKLPFYLAHMSVASVVQQCAINPLNTKRRLLYLKTQFVPCSKHFSSRL